MLPFLALSLVPGLAFAWLIWGKYPADLYGFNHQLVVRDYINLWAGGHLVAEGRTDLLFEPLPYWDWLRSVFGERLDIHTWSYPPHFLLLAVPLGKLPLVPGFLTWIGATSALLWAALRIGGLPPLYALAVVLSPAALENALTGQNSALITGAALAGGLLISERRPVLAGALLGLLSLKPQLGLLVPVCLLARREWRTFVWAGVFGAGYCIAGLAAFGWHAWVAYATVTVPFMRGYLDAPFGLAAHYMMVPPFITMRALGAGLHLAYAVQAAAAVGCMLLSWWAWSKRDVDRRAAVALTLCLAPLATPYAHAYDLICVAAACAILAQLAAEAGGLRPWSRLSLGLGWLWPGVAFVVGLAVMPGLGPVFVEIGRAHV